MIRRMKRTIVMALLIVALLPACNLNRVDSRPHAVSADSDSPPTAPARPAPVDPAASTETAPPSRVAPSRCAPEAERPARQIQATVNIDYARKQVLVSQRIAFLNREKAPLHKIVLDAQANQWAGSFVLESLRVESQSAEYRLERNRLELALARALESGCWLEIELEFRLQPDEIRDGLRSYRGFYGYSARQLNLGHFLPTVAPRYQGGWRIHEPIGIGEQIVYEVADWDVEIQVTGAAESLQLAAPGTVKRIDAGHWTVWLPGSRDFAISLSESFVLRERQLDSGITLAVYAFADAVVNDRSLELDGAAHVLEEAGQALAVFTRLFGEYTWRRLVIVQGDFPDGMEFSGLVFVGSAWFYGFDGTSRNYLSLISVHEIAHQWWYARVGNDAAINPWLDEALATYSEYLFIEARHPADMQWWWSFRVAPYFPQGKVDYPVYEFSTPRAYINAIYLRGAQMLQNLRQDIGDAAFFALLRAYYQAGDNRIADPKLFWGQLGVESLPKTDGTRREFLSDPIVAGAEEHTGS